MAREYTYHVDLEGLLWHDGLPTDVPTLYEAFFRSLKRLDDGRLQARCQGEICWIVPVDTAFVVDSVDAAPDPAGAAADAIELIFAGGVREPLNPEALSVGADNVLYAQVRKGDFPARFSRKAYYQLARFVEEDGDGFALRLAGDLFRIANSASR